MSSKAWYKPSAVPRLVRKFRGTGTRSVEVWETTCIVTNFGLKRKQRQEAAATPSGSGSISAESAGCSVLVNPANPDLSGPHKFPYFPRGGPEPRSQPKKDAHHIMGYVTQWGGMDVGTGMLFSAAVIDGLVHQLGGLRLRAECKLKRTMDSGTGERCPVGKAVATSSGGSDLKNEYDHIVHTVPPFFRQHPQVVGELRCCYQESLDLAFALEGEADVGHQETRVAVPLLGAGCRGFPLEVALNIAAQESARWINTDEGDGKENTGNRESVIAFGVLEDDIARKLADAIDVSISINKSYYN